MNTNFLRKLLPLLALLALVGCSGSTALVAEVPALPQVQDQPTSTPTGLPEQKPVRATPTIGIPPAEESHAPAPVATIDPLDPYAAQLTPTARPEGSPPQVGIQVGHWRTTELPEELARFRTSTGARYGNITESDLNLDIAQRLVPLLQAEGVVVDLLPATVPNSYTADAFVALHADGNRSSGPRGFKLATPWRTSRASQMLIDRMTEEYRATGLPHDAGGVTTNMRGYYPFNNRRFQHAIARTTPAVIVEMGFLTNAADRSVMLGQPDLVARSLFNGIMRYLRERDPNDRAALLTPQYPAVRPQDAGIALRATPSERGRVVAQLDASRRLRIFNERDGWLQVFVAGAGNIQGWVPRGQVVIVTGEAPPPPPPPSDS